MALRQVGCQTEGFAMISILVKKFIDPSDDRALLRHHPREVEVVRPDVVQGLIHATELHRFHAPRAKQVLQRRAMDEIARTYRRWSMPRSA